MVRDVRYRALTEVQFDMYDPAAQTPIAATDLIVRTAGQPLPLLAEIERQARELDPRAIVSRVATLDAIVSEARAPWRFVAWVMAIFAGLAFLLSTVGLVSLAPRLNLGFVRWSTRRRSIAQNGPCTSDTHRSSASNAWRRPTASKSG